MARSSEHEFDPSFESVGLTQKKPLPAQSLAEGLGYGGDYFLRFLVGS